MWPLIIFLVLFPSPSYSAKAAEPTVASQQTATLPPASGDEGETPKKKLQLGISTDDSYIDNPKIMRSAGAVENFSKSLGFRRTGSIGDDIGVDKTRSFSKTFSMSSQGSTDKNEDTDSDRLSLFTKSLSRSSSRSSRLTRLGSFSSVGGSFRQTTDDDSDAETDDFESLPGPSMSGRSFASYGTDDGRELDLQELESPLARSSPKSSSPKSSFGRTESKRGSELELGVFTISEVLSTPKSFVEKPKAYSAEDMEMRAAAENKNFWTRLSHKVFTASVTPYRMLRLPKREVQPIDIKDFTLIRSVHVLRHSVRLPTEDLIVEMKEILPKLKTLLKEAAGRERNNKDIEYWQYTKEMDDWTMYDELAKEGVKMKTLVREGKTESLKMGQRFATFYKNLLPEEFNKKSIIVKFTDCPRTKDTAFSFIEGLYDKLPEGNDWYEEVEAKKSVLKYDSTCTVWKSFKKSDLSQYLSKNFLNGSYMKATAKDVAARCNLTEEEFNVDDLLLVYETCSFEIAWMRFSPWCSLLTEEHMKVLEYAADLELHIIAGYANVMNTKIPCKLYNDLMHHLLDNKDLKVLFYVTHLTSVLKFLTFLGLYQDLDFPLIRYREEYEKKVEDRNWRTAYIGSFTTNISFLLFEDTTEKKLWIQVRHQERPVHITLCPMNADLMCPLDEFEMNFEKFSYGNCQFDEWCKEEKIYPKENKKYLQKEYPVGKRRQRLLKEFLKAEAEKEAEKNKGIADEEHEKDRTQSAGAAEHVETLEDQLKSKKTDEGEAILEVKEIKETKEGQSELQGSGKSSRMTQLSGEIRDDPQK